MNSIFMVAGKYVVPYLYRVTRFGLKVSNYATNVTACHSQLKNIPANVLHSVKTKNIPSFLSPISLKKVTNKEHSI
jgi:hypothetical protein